jgi:UDP-N-acetylmuramyl pentapeptide phosphotransferase/UDP-N-acetylglucosamine-1-phosphate transferase
MHIRFSADHVDGGPQKFHHAPIPRIGGIAILGGLILGAGVLALDGTVDARTGSYLFVSLLPVFLTGLAEDLTKGVSARTRLFGSFAAGAVAFWLLDAELRRLGIPGVDSLLQVTPLAILVSLFCMGGVAHAINIIDGYNGLAAGVGILILAGLGAVAYQAGDALILNMCLVSIAAIGGFLVCNYPRGAIFAGDCGAYLIGFLIAVLSVMLIARNEGVSPWCPMLLAIYPVWETLFSIYRKRYLRGHSPHDPDGLHLHMLVYKRLVRLDPGQVQPEHKVSRNSGTSPYLWLLSATALPPAILFWNNTALLMAFCVAFALGYCELYWSIVKFRSPRWLRRRIPVGPLPQLEGRS